MLKLDLAIWGLVQYFSEHQANIFDNFAKTGKYS